jgi:hypothetical protein
LAEDYRQSNRARTRALATQLALIGYEMRIVADGDPTVVELTSEHIEVLARAEHERWRAERRAAGWRRGAVKDSTARTHPDLVEWDELRDEMKDQNRASVAELPMLLWRAGVSLAPRACRTTRPSRAGTPLVEQRCGK